MFEQMLKELILKLIREDSEVRTEFIHMMNVYYDISVTHAVKHSIENDGDIQDVIRKQATTDIWEAIEDDVDRRISDCVDELIVVRR